MARFPKLDRRAFCVAGAGAAVALTGLDRLGFGGRFGTALADDATITPFMLMVVCRGGWDQSMVFDNKLTSSYVAKESGAKAGIGAGNIPFVDHPNRPATALFFKTFGDNAAIVNGLYAGSLDHRQALLNGLSAVPPGKHRPTDWLTFYAASVNPAAPMPHTAIDAPYIPGAYTEAVVRLTTPMIQDYLTPLAGATGLGAGAEAGLADFRSSAFSKFASQAADGSLDQEKLAALYYGYAREATIQAQLATASKTLGAPGADNAFTRNGKIAVELFAQNASQAVTIQAGADDLWDTTTDTYTRQTANYEMLFGGLNSIIAYAGKRNVASKMLVVVVSELGRAPQLNSQGGKGPWPYTSALLWGAGINGGSVVGLTDPALRGLPIDPLFGGQSGSDTVTLTPANVFAALYLKCNVPVKLMLPDTKPLSLVLKGTA